jgi:tetratricopeptide (TPR) repeat protein
MYWRAEITDNHPVAQPTVTICNACGVSSQLHDAFRNEPNSIRKFCPPCWQRRDAANDRIYLGTYLFLGLLGTVLACYQSQWGFLLLMFFLFHVFGILATVPHELGHALAARAFGMHVFQVAVGVGKKLFECRLFGVLVEFRTIPYGGMTLALSDRREHFRMRQSVYALAGPVANLIVALTVLAIVGWDRIADFRPHEKVSPWTLLFASNVVVFLTNLWPHVSVSSTGAAMLSDGAHLLRAFRMKEEHREDLRSAFYIAHADAARQRCDMKAAAEWIERGLRDYPEDRELLLQHGVSLIEAQKFSEARTLFQKLLQNSDADDLGIRALLMNDIACVDALIGGQELLDEADEYSDYSLKILPWMAGVKGTRGMVLVERGALLDAIPLLEASWREAEEPWGRAQSACFLAIAEARRGNHEKAMYYLKLARELHPRCFLIPRAERSMASV